MVMASSSGALLTGLSKSDAVVTNFVGHGVCAITAGGPGLCHSGESGSWEGVNSLDECVERCRGCANCNYVSHSPKRLPDGRRGHHDDDFVEVWHAIARR